MAEDGQDFERKVGTTVADFYDCILRMLRSIGHATPDSRRLFTMDDLLAHKNRQVITPIHEWGHRVCFRAPYYSVDGAIEYVFNKL